MSLVTTDIKVSFYFCHHSLNCDNLTSCMNQAAVLIWLISMNLWISEHYAIHNSSTHLKILISKTCTWRAQSPRAEHSYMHPYFTTSWRICVCLCVCVHMNVPKEVCVYCELWLASPRNVVKETINRRQSLWPSVSIPFVSNGNQRWWKEMKGKDLQC